MLQLARVAGGGRMELCVELQLPRSGPVELLFFVTAESACFFLGSEKTKQLFCFLLSEEELDSCRTSAVVEKHLIFFSFTAQLCCIAEKGKDQAERERIFTICRPGSLFYPFL